MKRILHIVGKMNRAGAETMIMNLYRAIDKSKYQFDFLYFSDEVCDYDSEILSLGGQIFRLPEPKNPIKRMFALEKLLKDKQIEAIHCHTLLSNAFHLYAGYKAGIKYRIAHSHNTSDQNSNTIIGKLYEKFAISTINKYATHFITCGIEAGKYLFPKQDKPLLLPNAIDTESFIKLAKKENNDIRKTLSISPDTLLIIQIGRLLKVKNHQFTIDLANTLKKSHTNFKILLIGDGILREELKMQIKNYDLEEYVSLLGVREDIPALLANSDVMVMPSLHEGFPVVLVESQTIGTPAVVSTSISQEVDLGVGLVDFLDLNDSHHTWIEKILSVSQKEQIDEKERLEIIKEQGFDTFTSARYLEKLYDSFNLI